MSRGETDVRLMSQGERTVSLTPVPEFPHRGCLPDPLVALMRAGRGGGEARSVGFRTVVWVQDVQDGGLQ